MDQFCQNFMLSIQRVIIDYSSQCIVYLGWIIDYSHVSMCMLIHNIIYLYP